jgi:kumamolisin
MKIKRFAAMTLALLAVGVLATAQIKPMSGKVLVPDSSIEKPTDIGHAAHTNIQVFLPKELLRNEQTSGPPYGGYAYETPASLACVYGLVTPVTGCNPNAVTKIPVGGARMIAIVDAYDAPNAASDLAKFSTQFGLPPASFQVVYASGAKPPYNMGWEFEESLDVLWSHAMAPEARIVLVEAASNSFKDLMAAEDMASKMVNAAGGGEVSNS